MGCGSYVARLVNDGLPILEARKAVGITWSRRLDEASTATLTIPVSGTDLAACCVGVNRIEPLRTELIIERDGIPVWMGWILRDVTIGRDTIIVNATDILGWTDRRVLGTHTHIGVDLTDIALDYIADVNGLGDLPFVITSTPSGILADRTVLAPEYKFASEPLRELFETGLDATVVAGVLIMGPETQVCGTLQLRDTDINGDPEIKMDGVQRATRVIVKGVEGIVAISPASPPDVCFHAADTVITDEQILDQVSADAAAAVAYEQLSSSYPYHVGVPEGSSLLPSAPVHINALIPGAIVQFYSQALCLQVAMAMRLVAVDVEATAGEEQVRIALEPLGDEIVEAT